MTTVYRQYGQVVIERHHGGATRITLDRDVEHESATRDSLGKGWGRVPIYGGRYEYEDEVGEWEFFETEVITGGPLDVVLTVFDKLVTDEFGYGDKRREIAT